MIRTPSLGPRMAVALCAALVAAGLSSGCASDGAVAHRWQSAMLDAAPPESGARVVVLHISDPGQLAASEFAIFDLKEASGVLKVRRGAGTNEVYALVESTASAESLVLALQAKGHGAYVVREVTRAELDAKK